MVPHCLGDRNSAFLLPEQSTMAQRICKLLVDFIPMRFLSYSLCLLCDRYLFDDPLSALDAEIGRR